jgi:oligopeptidase B
VGYVYAMWALAAAIQAVTLPIMDKGRSEIKPPFARQVPVPRTFHGDTVVDEYTWLDDAREPETIAFLEAQNAYAATMTAGQTALREAIFGEIRARTVETDLVMPVRKGDWWYYTRTIEGSQYPVHCRRAVRAAEAGPPVNHDGSPLDGEQILLDGNQMAAGHEYFSLGTVTPSPDGTALAYSTDFTGNERFTIRISDLASGETRADELTGAYYGVAWSLDGSVLFYVTVNDAWRPHQVWRHAVGTDAARDVLVFEEQDERFGVTVSLTRSERFVRICCESKLTSEVWLIDAANPLDRPWLVAPRRPGVEYTVDHQASEDGSERLVMLHNDGARNFELATAPVSAPARLRTLLPHREDTRLLGVQVFEKHLVVSFRRDGLTGVRIIRADADQHDVEFDEPVCTVLPGSNPDYGSRSVRLSYGSLVTPDSIYDYDPVARELTLLRLRPVLALPGGPEFDPGQYEQYREWAMAADGTPIPISVVCKRGLVRDGSAPFLLFGYGSYEISVDPSFSVPRLSLLDRGFAFGIAHVRGGGEFGRRWYDDGKLLNKMNTFTDFIACARHLAMTGWTNADRLIARGGSAGGLLVGAAVNLAPDAFGGVLAQVPFVDPLTAILDPSRPLTVSEWEEWGNPLLDPEVYAYMRAYSPYENVGSSSYPPILAITSLNDTRVSAGEAAKWITRLQAKASGGAFLLRTEMIAGHRGRSGRYDVWREEAAMLAWTIETAQCGRSGSRAKSMPSAGSV